MKDNVSFRENGQRATQANSLGWFLLTWRQGDLANAGLILNSTSADSPAYAVMSFLLDESRTPEQLLAALPAELYPVGQLAIGERHLKRGEFDSARFAFDAAIQAVDNNPARNWDVNRDHDVRTVALSRLTEIKQLQKEREVPP